MITRDEISYYLYRIIPNGRKNQIKNKYQLPFEQLIDYVFKQQGKCAICEVQLNFESRKWHVDHDHTTGKARGVLCHHCNTNLVPVFDTYFQYVPKILKYLGKSLSYDIVKKKV